METKWYDRVCTPVEADGSRISSEWCEHMKASSLAAARRANHPNPILSAKQIREGETSIEVLGRITQCYFIEMEYVTLR